MDPRVRAELDTLLVMVGAWRDEKIRHITPEGGDGYLVSDLREEIEENVYPYARRMLECGYVSEKELAEFLDQCFEEVEYLNDRMG